jgi:hypothetical protein
MIFLNSRKIRIHDIANSMLACLMSHESQTPIWVNRWLSPLLLSEVSLSGNRHLCCHASLPSQIPELWYAHVPIPRHVNSSLRPIGNRGIAISKVTIPLHRKVPNAESRLPGISCHLSPNDQQFRLDQEIANRDFNSYETLASRKPDKMDPDKP